MISGQGNNLAAERGTIQKVALPGTAAAGPQGVFVHPLNSEGFFNRQSTLVQNLIHQGIGRGTVNPGTKWILPTIVECPETVAMA